MHWSIWFCAKYRAVSLFLMSILLLLALLIGRYVQSTIWHEELMLAQAQLRNTLLEKKRKKEELMIWLSKKSQVQKGLIYIISGKSSEMKSILKHWQTTYPQRKVRFNVEKIGVPSNWHHTMARLVYRYSLRFWVQDEADLLQAWQEKKRFPCLQVTENITINRATEGGVWIEEQAVCVQF